ncbi:thermostable hemolysin [Pseudidiomarina mangrovi]|uniref:thermostable hemolysin n=1 Tax=Pseudidiomarina mangrovi TaxID=2487133 RepID=UPI0013DF6155|nr:thermostable hemolysin [Pseudidiomarina mangrovi]
MLSSTVVSANSSYPQSITAQYGFHYIGPSHPLRATIEQFICAKYWLSFAACLEQLPLHLIAILDQQQQPVAACALTPAAEQSLFCEHYLPQPAEQLITASPQQPVSRQQLLEVGSMACVDHRYLPLLFTAVIHAANELQRPWLVFTATTPLRRHLKRFNLPTTVLGQALDSALPTTQHQQWGRYYSTQPLVVSGHVAAGQWLYQQLSDQVVWESL